jgi:hypothetical protein
MAELSVLLVAVVVVVIIIIIIIIIVYYVYHCHIVFRMLKNLHLNVSDLQGPSRLV